MIAKKHARRTAAALVVPALLMTAACGGSDDDAGKNEVSGKPGAKPKVTLAKDAKPPEKVQTKTLTEGKGRAAQKGDFVRLDVLGKLTGDPKGKGQDLVNSWNAKKSKNGAHTQMVTQLGGQSPQQQALPPSVMKALIGKKPGSRVQVEGSAASILGAQQAKQAKMKPGTGMIWVLDLAGADKVNPKEGVKGEQDKVKSGLPDVDADGKKAAKISIPKGQEPPKDLEQQTLVKGKGPEVKNGDGVVAQYNGVKWEDGKTFDSSWGKGGGARPFQVGTGTVVPAWDKALVGKHVGDRVLLSAPPKDAYNNPKVKQQQQQQQQQSGQPPKKNPLEKNTLVFVVDIVGKA